MRRKNALRFHEEVMLLALRDREGTVFSGTMYNFAVGGALLAELMMEKRIEVETAGKRTFVRILNSTPLDNPLLDEALAKIAVAGRRGQLRTWVGKFAQMRNLKHRAAEDLVRRGILRADEGKVLGIFTRKIYPEMDPRPEQEIIERLRQAIFEDGNEVDPRTAVLLSLAKSADLLRLVFKRKDLKGRKKRIARIVNGELTGKATQEAIQAMQAAVMVAVIVPAAAAVSS